MNPSRIDDMPPIGFGLWKVSRDDCADVVHQAIRAGYRHFDGACDYGNETEVGAGIARALDEGLCTREELWITSKLWNTYHAPEHVAPAFERSLSDLGLDYLDLYLVHFPIALAYVPFETRYPPEWIFDPEAAEPKMVTAPVPLEQTWRAMEALKDDGRVRHIGVCNYSSGLLHDLMSYARRPPELLQIEAHPQLAQPRLLRLAKQYGLAVTAFSPLGALSYLELDMATPAESVLDDPRVRSIAERVGCSPAQAVLAWHLARGTSVVVKSTNAARMQENLAADRITLSAEDLSTIDELDVNRRYNDPGAFCEAAFGTFHPIYD